MEVAPGLDSSVFSVVVVMWSVGLFLFGFLQRLFPHGGFFISDFFPGGCWAAFS